MRLVALLAGIEHDPLRLVFSGGTSLSKGYNLIRRFSEDLDFKLVLPKGGVPRSVRSGYRRQVVQAIRATGNWTIEDTDIQVGNASQFFSCLIGYSNSFAPARGLRPQVKLEVTFSAPAFPPEKRPLRSFVAEGRKEGPEVAAIACVSPVETAADKLSALTWRVLTRQRGGARDEPALIRHLHDLAALETLASEHPEFPELLLRLLVQDAARGRAVPEIAAMTPGHRLAAALDMLAGDPDYRAEYDRFVLGMSYAPAGETPSFQTALEAARCLAKLIS